MSKLIADLLIATMIAGNVPAQSSKIDTTSEVSPPAITTESENANIKTDDIISSDSQEKSTNQNEPINLDTTQSQESQSSTPESSEPSEKQEKPSEIEITKPIENEASQPPIAENPTVPENKKFDHDIASYITKYTGSDSLNRNYNMRLASDSIHGVILQPGETFSFNDTILAKSHNGKDYKSAPVYVNGKVSSGIGGGICQISSTLYQASLYSGMTITQRRNHSLRVGYMPAGRDATVSWGTIDLQFRNDLNIPVMIESVMKNNTIKVRFLSQKIPKIGEIKVVVSPKNSGYILSRIRENGVVDYTASSYYRN